MHPLFSATEFDKNRNCSSTNLWRFNQDCIVTTGCPLIIHGKRKQVSFVAIAARRFHSYSSLDKRADHYIGWNDVESYSWSRPCSFCYGKSIIPSFVIDFLSMVPYTKKLRLGGYDACILSVFFRYLSFRSHQKTVTAPWKYGFYIFWFQIEYPDLFLCKFESAMKLFADPINGLDHTCQFLVWQKWLK